MISHDRELLEHVDGIWELTNQGLSFYGGGFSTYEELKRQERERLSQEIDVARREKKKQEREHTEKIEKQAKRTRVAEKKAPDVGLPKILLGARKRQAQVSMAKINRNESERDQAKQEHFQNLLQRQKNSSDLRLDFSLDGKVKGKTIFRLEDFNYRYPGAESFLWKENLNWTFHAQDRLIIRGENGTGKSTLLKLLTKRLDISSGEAQGDFTPITRGFVYLDQNYSELASEKNVMENLAENNRYDVTETRNKLADFGFFKKDVFKLVAVLSGGEKLRLSLAKMAFSRQPPEVWILDEPTNNLDLESLSVLEKALLEYEGSLLVTSHDEIFLERIGCGQEIKLCHHKKR